MKKPAPAVRYIFGGILVVALIVIGNMAWFFYKWQTYGEYGLYAHEERLISDLGRVRGALTAYKNDSGMYPQQLEQLVPDHLPYLPRAEVFDGVKGEPPAYYDDAACKNPAAIKGMRGFGYINDPKSDCFGKVFLDRKNHRKSKRKGEDFRAWLSY